MIYLLVSRSIKIDDSVRIETGTPLHIKVPGKNDEEQPIIGFETISLADKFLARKNISRGEYMLILKDRRLSDYYKDQAIFLIENEPQLDEIEKNAEGYDYESHIFKNAL